jgi:hypothetical protein
MSKKKLIDAIEVKSPCSENWDEMQGNDRVRFCSHCAKSVNDLSRMTRREAVRLVRASGGEICIRYIKHPKTNKPLFAENLYRITRRAPGLAAGVITATMSFSAAVYAQGGNGAFDSAPAAAESRAESPREKPRRDKTDGPPAGAVSGVVADSQGAVIPSIQISISNEGSGDTRKTISNGEGFYEFRDLPAGTYSIQFVGSMGFITKNVTGVAVSDAAVSSNDVVLDVNMATVTAGGAIVVSVELEHPLSAAVQNDDLDEVQNLISRGARVNVREKDSGGITPLFIAVENGNKTAAEILIRFGAKINIRDSERRTPLMMLDDDAEDGLVELLVHNGAKLDLTDNDGNTALILAAENAEGKTVNALIAVGAGVNFQNKSGETALMKAVDRSDLEMVLALILAGADVNLKNDDGETAWDLTADDEVEKLLESYGGVSGTPDDEPAEETGESVPLTSETI